jgi:hypothetical protein
VEYTYRHTDSWDGFMIYSVEMGSVKIASAVQKLIGVDTQTEREYGDRISLLFFFEIRIIG